MRNFGSGSVLTFMKMRESKIKSPGLVAYPKILVSGIKSEYNIFCNRLSNVQSDELMCVKAACKSEYSKYSKFGNIYESGKISSCVNLAQQESYVGEMYHNSASDGDSTGCFFGPLNSMHAVL